MTAIEIATPAEHRAMTDAERNQAIRVAGAGGSPAERDHFLTVTMPAVRARMRSVAAVDGWAKAFAPVHKERTAAAAAAAAGRLAAADDHSSGPELPQPTDAVAVDAWATALQRARG